MKIKLVISLLFLLSCTAEKKYHKIDIQTEKYYQRKDTLKLRPLSPKKVEKMNDKVSPTVFKPKC